MMRRACIRPMNHLRVAHYQNPSLKVPTPRQLLQAPGHLDHELQRERKICTIQVMISLSRLIEDDLQNAIAVRPQVGKRAKDVPHLQPEMGCPQPSLNGKKNPKAQDGIGGDAPILFSLARNAMRMTEVFVMVGVECKHHETGKENACTKEPQERMVVCNVLDAAGVTWTIVL
mmetsp:Transcript_28592/g.39850  ORF Transcript_28592/g.39850 Transcript_28592/m.39850 type:complete len:173 (+) Transcript_28592:1680-2198(+)